MKFKQNKAFNPISIKFETADEAELFWEMMRDVCVTNHVSYNVRAIAKKLSDHFSTDAQLGG